MESSLADAVEASRPGPNQGSNLRPEHRNPEAAHRFSIGICASGSSSRIVELLRFIGTELVTVLPDFELGRIVVVASGCPGITIDGIRSVPKMEDRLVLVEEPRRLGKAEALNRIFELCVGDFLLLINADAFPSKGSIQKLLRSIAFNESVGIVCAKPFFEPGNGMTDSVEQLMWSVHNESSNLLNHLDVSNHGNDEMMIVRTGLLGPLPYELVNDGAFISGRAKKARYSVKFCDGAGVKIEVPSTIAKSIGQRRRIIFGHFQVWKLIGVPPTTIESLLLFSPLLSLRILIRTVAKSPGFLLSLPVATWCELLSLLMALKDVAQSTDKHRIWKRYER